MNGTDDRLPAALGRATPPAPRREALERARKVAATASRQPGLPVWMAMIAAPGLCLGLGSGWVYFGGRSGSMVGNSAAPLAVGLIVAILLGVLGVLGFAGDRGPSLRARGLSLALVPATVVAVLLAGSGASNGHPFAMGASCLLAEVALAALPAGVALWFLTDRAFRPWRTFCAGLSASTGALLALHLHCPDGTPAHLALFHLLPWLGVGAVVVLVRRWLPTRSYAP